MLNTLNCLSMFQGTLDQYFPTDLNNKTTKNFIIKNFGLVFFLLLRVISLDTLDKNDNEIQAINIELKKRQT